MAKKTLTDTKGLSLTKRDYELLGALYHLRILTTSQLQRLFFQNTQLRYTQKRLADLKDHDFLNSANYSSWGDRQENRYFLTKKGIQIAEAVVWENSNDENMATYTASQNYVDESQQEHQLLINELFIRLVENKVFPEDRKIIDLLNRDWKETRRAIVDSHGVRLKPDACFKIGDTIYWVEVDRGTEKLSHIKQKFSLYQKVIFHQDNERKNVLLFFCFNGYKFSEKVFRKRINDIRKIAINKLNMYFGEKLEVYVDEYEKLVDILIERMIRKKDSDALVSFAKELEAFAVEKGYIGKAVKEPASNPVKSEFKADAWFQYQTPASKQFFIIMMLNGMPLSAVHKVREVYGYCYQFESLTKVSLKAIIVADQLIDLIDLNQLYSCIREVGFFTTLDKWKDEKSFYRWYRGKLKVEVLG